MATMSFLPGAITRHPIVTAASAAAVAFLGYCVYFDRKRRSAPDYKQKIRQSKFFLLIQSSSSHCYMQNIPVTWLYSLVDNPKLSYCQFT